MGSDPKFYSICRLFYPLDKQGELSQELATQSLLTLQPLHLLVSSTIKNDLVPGTVSDCLGYTWRKQKQTFSCPRRWWGNDGIRELPGARDQQGRDHADQLPWRLQQKQWIAFLWGNCIGDWGENGVKFRISAVIIDNFSNDHHRKNPVYTSRGELYLEEHVANKTIFIFKTKTISLSITNVLLSQTRLSVRERW